MNNISFHYSVIIPLYNKADHISRTIDSVLKQTFTDFELIIVNDGSTDGGELIVKEYVDSRIKLIDQKNAGVSAARNCGIEHAQGKYIAFIDADDTWLPDFLKTIRCLIRDFPEADVYATGYKSKNKDGSYTEYIFDPLPRKSWQGIIPNYFTCLARNPNGPMWTSALCVKKSLLVKVGGFDSGLKIGEDIDLWIKLFLNAKVAFSSKVSSIYFLDVLNSSREIITFYDEEYKFIIKMKKRLERHEIPEQFKDDYIKFISKKLITLIKLYIIDKKRQVALKILRENWRYFTLLRNLKFLFRIIVPNKTMRYIERIRKYLNNKVAGID